MAAKRPLAKRVVPAAVSPAPLAKVIANVPNAGATAIQTREAVINIFEFILKDKNIRSGIHNIFVQINYIQKVLMT